MKAFSRSKSSRPDDSSTTTNNNSSSGGGGEGKDGTSHSSSTDGIHGLDNQDKCEHVHNSMSVYSTSRLIRRARSLKLQLEREGAVEVTELGQSVFGLDVLTPSSGES